LSITETKFDGSIDGAYVPWIGARLDADGPDPLVVVVDDVELELLDDPQPAIRTSAEVTASAAIVRGKAVAIITGEGIRGE
jgi:hypothetical protein